MSRLAAGVWVSAYLARLQAEGIAVYVVARGDETAGAVLVKLATLDGRAKAFHRVVDLLTGARAWDTLAEGPEREVDESIAKQRRFDPDLWVIEVEDAKGRHLLDAEGLSD
ncbi:MAG: DUF1491 family protein [Maritimibacter sp.]|nr:DUF1491 family protein [Maritimibacter sp.]